MGRLPRNFAPVDTDLFSDPKIRGLSPSAKLLFVASLLDCNKEMTDGKLKRSDADHLARLVNARSSSRAELLTAGLWIETPTGFEVVGFLGHNKSRAERTKAAADAKARYEDWLKRHDNDVYNAVDNALSFPPENQRTEIRDKSKAAAIGDSVA